MEIEISSEKLKLHNERESITILNNYYDEEVITSVIHNSHRGNRVSRVSRRFNVHEEIKLKDSANVNNREKL